MLTRKQIDRASLMTMIVTAVLFLAAAFEKGISHDLLLEAGVFLVSVKLILASRKAELSSKSIEVKLRSIESQLQKIDAQWVTSLQKSGEPTKPL